MKSNKRYELKVINGVEYAVSNGKCKKMDVEDWNELKNQVESIFNHIDVNNINMIKIEFSKYVAKLDLANKRLYHEGLRGIELNQPMLFCANKFHSVKSRNNLLIKCLEKGTYKASKLESWTSRPVHDIEAKRMDKKIKIKIS